MKVHRETLPSTWAQVFGFAVLALVLADGECKLNRAKAQIVIENPCSEERLRFLYGDQWHIFYFLNGCWMTEPQTSHVAPNLSRFHFGGRR